ncbi:MAG: glycosyltransferase [Fusobacteriaceae bacterium]
MELSIIVPIYNVENYLRECLDSLYKIEGIDYEIILVNDGSTDSSLQVVREYEKNDNSKTIVIDKENGGLSSARNAGLKRAKGEYISFIDSDDFIDNTLFQDFFHQCQKEKLDVAVGNMRYYQEGKFSPPLFRSEVVKSGEVMNGKKFLDLIMDKPKCFREEVVDDLYRRDFLEENGLFFKEEILHEDTLFTPSVYLKAEKVKYLDYPFYFYRQRVGGIMSEVTQKSIDSLSEICCILEKEHDRIEGSEGKRALSKLIISFYKVIVYREYEKNPKNREFYRNFRKFYLKLKGYKNGVFNEDLLFISLELSVLIRKILNREIKNVQKIPKI